MVDKRRASIIIELIRTLIVVYLVVAFVTVFTHWFITLVYSLLACCLYFVYKYITKIWKDVDKDRIG